MKRFPQILLVWLGCAFAWTVLGTSLVARSGESSSALLKEVHLLWGKPLEQGRPAASWLETRRETERVRRTVGTGRTEEVEESREVERPVELPLEGSDLAARIGLTHRRKGLLWFPTYTVDFRGRYRFANPGEQPHDVALTFPLAGDGTVYDGFEVRDESGARVEARVACDSARWSARFAPGETRAYTVAYRSRGTSTWTYRPTDGAGEVRDFTLALDTDFRNVDFAPGSIAPSTQSRGAPGWQGTWRFERLVASAPIGLVLPERLNPGPLAARITFFAPVGLLFFFFVVAIVAASRGVALHPMHYFFLGCAFFAFHLLFAYLVDHLAIPGSFTIASAVSVLLVVTYARLFTGWRFALEVMGLAQLVYLVLFSFTFFWSGFTGLAVTVGAVLTLFVMMQMTGRTDWERSGSAARAGGPA